MAEEPVTTGNALQLEAGQAYDREAHATFERECPKDAPKFLGGGPEKPPSCGRSCVFCVVGLVTSLYALADLALPGCTAVLAWSFWLSTTRTGAARDLGLLVAVLAVSAYAAVAALGFVVALGASVGGLNPMAGFLLWVMFKTGPVGEDDSFEDAVAYRARAAFATAALAAPLFLLVFLHPDGGCKHEALLTWLSGATVVAPIVAFAAVEAIGRIHVLA